MCEGQKVRVAMITPEIKKWVEDMVETYTKTFPHFLELSEKQQRVVRKGIKTLLIDSIVMNPTKEELVKSWTKFV